ncbi:hypothetical protein PpBr36_00409 [Pyricularia pennisetigena]|uniref:hypothetical protein n=1 Tax=Pyricularia pennisetigena TaxID=1578925 RepID=UPI00114F1484|nr:hypothetical protein PpBr36_00409 [Pyricularia pennisetigena]TLS28542.1 hypothetical protein PpBr36_00409 [Pyricularia pennisetigena]
MRRPGILLVLGLLCDAVIASIGRDSGLEAQHVLKDPHGNALEAPAQRRLHGRFIHITDFHPDTFYKVHTSTDEDIACHRGEGHAGYYGAAMSDCDTPISLVNATFDWLDKHWKDKIDFIVWTGDSARHDSDEEIPRNAKQVLGTNRMIANKFTDLLYNESTRALSIPVIPTFGNNDILPHNIMLPGPNRWLQDYSNIWNHFIPEEQRHSFELGGYFYVEVIPNKLAVFSLNTLYFFDRNAAVDDCINPSEPGYKQLEWLRVQLHFMRQRGMKAIIIGHVPPARTPSKMLWDESCWQKYTLWMQQYRDVVTASIYGHMNIDHFMLQDSQEVDLHLLDNGGILSGGLRENLDDELTVLGATDYLKEMRDRWSKLPSSVGQIADGPSRLALKKKKKKHENLVGSWGERYSATMVGGSIVPNFYPSFRVYEYNTSGLEDAAIWTGPALDRTASAAEIIDITDRESMMHILAEIEKKKKKKGRKAKPKPKDPNLIKPEPPAKTAPPGPAYSPQPLTLLRYEQWFANLTRINSGPVDDESEVEAAKWRSGKPGNKPSKQTPGEFRFEVEYNTSTDKVLKIKDLTVPSFLKLAYRMGKKEQQGKPLDFEADTHLPGLEDADDSDLDWYVVLDEEGSDYGNETAVDRTMKKNKKKNKKKHKKHNKVWLRFLKHAFISTVDRRELEKLDG